MTSTATNATIKAPYYRTHELRITYGTSRGRDTYGYTVVSLHDYGKKRISCNGGGYDMRGTVFGDWIAREYQPRLLELADKFAAHWTKAEGFKSDNQNREKLYGGTFYPEGSSDNKKPHVTLDGACGFESMRRIAEAIGLQVRLINACSKCDVLTVTDTRTDLNA